ncbi:MAG: AAA family ATPase [Acidobacteria bacterium]|nr:AAA family ATPase [Acidobacteriota bacterium]MBI3422951.1 AAA family ATPase [Acidobacteriota bacterium]
MLKTLSVVVVGRTLNLQERVLLRNACQTPLVILAELPRATLTPTQIFEELQRLCPQAVLLFLDAELQQSFRLVGRLHQELPDAAVLCASENASAEVIVKTLRAGALECLSQPLNLEEVMAAFAKLEQQFQRPPEARPGKVIAVYSSKGGCGTTFVAANLAASLARVAQARTCLVDLNLQAGDQPLYLGLEPVATLSDVVQNFDRLDEQLLAKYLTPRTDRLSLLAAPTESGREEEVKVAHVMRVLNLLRSRMEYVVLDLPRGLDETTIGALDSADERVLLLTFDIPTIRSAKRALDLFKRLGYDRERIKLVVNRYEKAPEFDLKQVEKVLETRIYATLANDYPAAIASINMGEPLVLSKTQPLLTQDFYQLAGRLSGKELLPEHNAQAARSGHSSWFLFGRR